jgi:hypothetical protein
MTGKPDCDLKAVGMIVWQGGKRSKLARNEQIAMGWAAASPQAKCEDVTGWSAQMYTTFIGVNHSWPGWKTPKPERIDQIT